MGKNFKGGNKHKAFANSDRYHKDADDDDLIKPIIPWQKYAIVTKVLGSGMFNVQYFDHDNISYHSSLAHLRGNMKGNKKRFNFVSLHSIIIIQLIEYETIHKNSDIIHVYSNLQQNILLNNLPFIQKQLLLLTENGTF